jgi:amino acid transporter
LALSLTALWGLSTFSDLADGFVFTMWIFYGLAGAAIFTLRAKRPGAERPYRCWGYPLVPALFVLAALAMTVLQLWRDITSWDQARQPGGPSYPFPVPMTIFWSAVLVAGLPVYAVWRRFASSRAPAAP